MKGQGAPFAPWAEASAARPRCKASLVATQPTRGHPPADHVPPTPAYSYLETESYDKALVNLGLAKDCYIKGFNKAPPPSRWP